MPTYEYKCEKCGLRFKRWQAMAETPITECPECHGSVRRLVSGGSCFIVKGSEGDRVNHGGVTCSLEQEGRTCCGRTERCGKPACND